MLALATDTAPLDRAAPEAAAAEAAQAGLVRRRVRDLIDAVLRCQGCAFVDTGRFNSPERDARLLAVNQGVANCWDVVLCAMDDWQQTPHEFFVSI